MREKHFATKKGGRWVCGCVCVWGGGGEEGGGLILEGGPIFERLGYSSTSENYWFVHMRLVQGWAFIQVNFT